MNYGMDEIRYVLPREKPPKTTGRPIVTFRKVLDGILYILRTGCQWKLVPAEYVPILNVTEEIRSGLG